MKKLFCAALILTLIFISACGGTASPTPSPETTASQTPIEGASDPSPTPIETAEPTEAPYTNPLTGEGMDEDISALRPWAIMINNLDKALPQCGVSQADIIYEVPAEGGVTRMMAIFSDVSDVEAIGSMRSLRPYYADIGLSYDAIVVHAGGSEASYSEVYNYGIDHLDGVLGAYSETTFYRDPSRMAYGLEHSMFTTGERLITAAEGEGFDFEHEDSEYDYRLSFSDHAANQCDEKAEYVLITFNGYKCTSFLYDDDTDLYNAYEYGLEYTDGDTDEQMTFKNIIVLTTSISVIDDVGRLSVKLIGSGDGYFICGGKWVAITWQRDSNYEAFSYYLTDGTKLDLGVGTTYIGIMNKNGSSVAFEKQT